MKKVLLLLAFLLALTLAVPVAAEESAPTPIYTVDDLLAIGENPFGSYILMEDLDLSGVQWPCPDFAGTFDGNGHAILNLTLTQSGSQRATSYDGNQKAYDTAFAGFFGTLKNATVKDLKLLNVRALVVTDECCFLGGLAGYSEWSKISGCTVTGTLELRAHEKMFGIGGIVGYGSGSIEDSTADVTLICTDTDPNKRDEQFMGGAYATGFIDVVGCTVNIHGYCSEWGYVHNGGLVGMYMQHPLGKNRFGCISDNHVTGKITFFECNTDRRAYCKAIVGEILADWYACDDNTSDFVRDERKEYDLELRPEMCAQPQYTQTPIPSGCDSYGYTQYECTGCGYTYRDHYTLFSHTVSAWTLTKAPTVEAEGESRGLCDGCGITLFRSEPRLEPEPTTIPTTEPPTEEPTATPTETTEASETTPEPIPVGIDPIPIALVALGIVFLIALAVLLFPKKKGGKYLKK